VALTRLAAGRLRAPFVLDLALGLGPALAGRAARMAYLAALRTSAAVTVEADALRGELFGRAGGSSPRIHTIPIGLAPERIARLRAIAKARTPSPGLLRVLCLGSITPRKNQAMLVDAVAMLGADARLLKVTIAGDVHDQAYEDRLRRRVAEQGLESVVALAGWSDDVPRLMADADLLVHCARTEGVTHVIREAAFAKLPVVATAVGGVPDIVTHGVTGRLVALDNVAALAAELRGALETPVELARLAANSYARADTAFGPPSWVERYLALFARVARGPS